jgi:hypothetical protein
MDDYYICTKEDPWNESKGKRATHPDAISVSSYSDYVDCYKCPNCGKYFEIELPD